MTEQTDRAAETAPTPDELAPQPQPEPEVQPRLPETLPSPEERRALLEAIVYVAEEPIALEQLAEGLSLPEDVLKADLEWLMEESKKTHRGIEIRQVAGGYKMFTKAEHHDAVRLFVKTLRPKLRLSPAALETLAVIAYKQPVTLPEVQAVRGVNASGVIHTLLKHKLVSTAGRKKVIGKPMMYKTTREFLVQFGLNDVSELPNLKELEELSKEAFADEMEEAEEVEPTESPEEPAVDQAVAEAAEEAAETEEEK